MAEKREEKRAALRERLIDAAEARIADEGLGALKARDLAAEAGCAVGAIYNVFEDLNALVMAMNGRTFQALGARVAASQEGLDCADPHDCLIAMSHAYLGFAAENTNLWRALFDLKMSTDTAVPDWYLEELARLFAFIHEPLQRLYPGKDAADIDLLTRALFSSVHGIVLLGLEKRISGVPNDRIASMIEIVLREFGP
ncbi:MAG: TetR/AcrR family transcriptional regulator [Rhodobacteraceae bacterium]|nr:TetR/AcrR family transcriptional regulator [Paracoccaceae bacterium]